MGQNRLPMIIKFDLMIEDRQKEGRSQCSKVNSFESFINSETIC